jgi:two-component system heavy metal sensor histidine kinase CusS
VTPHSGSIVHKLEAGFTLFALLLAGLLAVFMDRALHRSLEAEDAQVLQGHAQVLLHQLTVGRPLQDYMEGPRPERASWRVLDEAGHKLSESQDLAGLVLPAVAATPGAQELEVGGRTFALVVRPWAGPMGRGQLLLLLDRSHEEELTRDFRRTLLVGVLLAGLLSALVARLLARWGLAPLGALIQETGSIGDLDLDRRLAPENFPLELQELVGTLNGALARLQEAFGRVGSLGAELAHELRTPLQNLRSSLENRARRSADQPVEPADLGILIEDCDRMAALIEQILFLARSEHGDSALSLIPIQVPELLEEARGFFEAAAEEAGVVLRTQAEAGLVVVGDRLLLTRALHNLTSNALRYAPAGGHVHLEAHAEGGGVWLSVADDGAGIPPDWLSRLGTPFLRPPESRSAEGLGLGLAIVKRIVAMLGGRLELESQVGQGTRVRFWISVT